MTRGDERREPGGSDELLREARSWLADDPMPPIEPDPVPAGGPAVPQAPPEPPGGRPPRELPYEDRRRMTAVIERIEPDLAAEGAAGRWISVMVTRGPGEVRGIADALARRRRYQTRAAEGPLTVWMRRTVLFPGPAPVLALWAAPAAGGRTLVVLHARTGPGWWWRGDRSSRRWIADMQRRLQSEGLVDGSIVM